MESIPGPHKHLKVRALVTPPACISRRLCSLLKNCNLLNALLALFVVFAIYSQTPPPFTCRRLSWNCQKSHSTLPHPFYYFLKCFGIIANIHAFMLQYWHGILLQKGSRLRCGRLFFLMINAYKAYNPNGSRHGLYQRVYTVKLGS